MLPSILLLLAVGLSSALAEPPAHIDITKLPAQSKVIDEVIVPVPSEVFAVLDHSENPIGQKPNTNYPVSPNPPATKPKSPSSSAR
ncbi:MAG: hypothetical protein NTX04_02890 [Verrucomicrobia bacterium]|nr:hypothetical protein [Verrucomicrobiota bacterium]